MAKEQGGFIKIDRKILNWGWYCDPNTRSLFIHCLLKANWKDGEWRGYQCKRGEFITSLANLSKETGLSVQQTRTALEHLISTGEITMSTERKYRVISVSNYDKYQTDNKKSNKVSTRSQQGQQQDANKVATTIEEINKNNKKYKEGDCVADCPSGEVFTDDMSRYYASGDR